VVTKVTALRPLSLTQEVMPMDYSSMCRPMTQHHLGCVCWVMGNESERAPSSAGLFLVGDREASPFDMPSWWACRTIRTQPQS